MHKTTGVAYQEDPDGTHHTLSVFAPVGDGRPWPTAVMIHGAGEPDYFYPWARNVARRGVVVFVPHWRYIDEPTPQQFRDSVEAESSQLTCAVRFARAETDRFGGDPGYLSLFGHSFGANLAARIVFAEPEVAPGCAASADATAPDNLVLTDGDWLAIGWGSLLRKDPELLEIVAPWSHLSSAPPPDPGSHPRHR